MLKDIPFVSAVSAKLQWLSARQSVLAQNIANAQTPGYVAQDLKKGSFAHLVEEKQTSQKTASNGLAITNASHIQARGLIDNNVRAEVDREMFESVPDGNTVSLEEQMLKVSQNQGEFQTALGLYKKATGLMRMAVRGSGR